MTSRPIGFRHCADRDVLALTPPAGFGESGLATGLLTAIRRTSVAMGGWARNTVRGVACAGALALAAPLLIPGAAHADPRYWSFIASCASADWFGTAPGPNSDGRFTCWAKEQGGLSGALAPADADDVFINEPTAAAERFVDFALALRGGAPAMRVHAVSLSGSTSFAAGLRIERGTLAASTFSVGVAAQKLLGVVEQSGGAVVVSDWLDVQAGEYRLVNGSLNAGHVFVGETPLSNARINVTGAASTLGVNVLTVGVAGTGRLDFAPGTRRSSDVALDTGTLIIGESTSGLGTMRVVGANWFVRGGKVVVGQSGSGLLEIAGGSVVTFFPNDDALSIGNQAGGVGRMTVSGDGTRMVNVREISVGKGGDGTLELLDGAVITTGVSSHGGVVKVGVLPGSRGEVFVRSSVAGAEAILESSTAMTVGLGGHGAVHVGPGGRVQVLASGAQFGKDGYLMLAGGVFRADSIAFADIANLRWTGGELSLFSAALDGTSLPRTLTLSGSHHLRTVSAVTVPDGSRLVLDGGLVTADRLNLLGSGEILGHGTVSGRVATTGGTHITANGALTMGTGRLADGVVLGGVLDAGGQTVTLLDADGAALGLLTRLRQGARLVAPSGVGVGSGMAMQVLGDATIDGALYNAGDVFVSAGTLTFKGSVSGPGQIVGNAVFEADFSPGDDVSETSFGDGDVTFGKASTLHLQIDTLAGQPRFDQVLGIDTLSFDGMLSITFRAGFLPQPGQRLQLLGFHAFRGILGDSNVSVTGLVDGRVDLSRLAIDGTIGVTPVPEPAPWMLCLAGFTALAVRRVRAGLA